MQASVFRVPSVLNELYVCVYEYAGTILCMRSANERRRYNVTSSLIGWAHIYKMIPGIVYMFM